MPRNSDASQGESAPMPFVAQFSASFGEPIAALEAEPLTPGQRAAVSKMILELIHQFQQHEANLIATLHPAKQEPAGH